MAAKIWYLPTEGATKHTEVDFARPLGGRPGPRMVARADSVESASGLVVTTSYGGRASIRVQHTWDTRGTGNALRRSLFTLVNHLQRGGTCVLAEDTTYAWAAFATILPGTHARKVAVGQSVLYALATSASPNGRECYVQSDPDTFYTELKLCSAFTGSAGAGGEVTFAADIAWPYQANASWCLVRESGTWPCLRLPVAERNGDHLVHEYERWFRLDLPLEEDPGGLDALIGSSVNSPTDGGMEPVPDGTTLPGGGGSGGSKLPPPRTGGWVW